MADPNLKANIIRILEQRGPLLVGSIAWAIKATEYEASKAVNDLVSRRIIERHEDGKRYQLVPHSPEAA